MIPEPVKPATRAPASLTAFSATNFTNSHESPPAVLPRPAPSLPKGDPLPASALRHKTSEVCKTSEVWRLARRPVARSSPVRAQRQLFTVQELIARLFAARGLPPSSRPPAPADAGTAPSSASDPRRLGRG